MAKKRIVWSTNASLELRQILQFHNHRNGSTSFSFQLINKIEQILNHISQFPFLGRITSNIHTRVFVLSTYSIFYEINEDRIEVVSIWDNRQDPSKLPYK